jgi:hypothetical protein
VRCTANDVIPSGFISSEPTLVVRKGTIDHLNSHYVDWFMQHRLVDIVWYKLFIMLVLGLHRQVKQHRYVHFAHCSYSALVVITS